MISRTPALLDLLGRFQVKLAALQLHLHRVLQGLEHVFLHFHSCLALNSDCTKGFIQT